MLQKKASLYDRDEKGELLPLEVKVEIDETIEAQLEYKDETIKVVPMPRGKIKRLFSEMGNEEDNKDFDGDIICEHCFEPKYTKEEIAYLKPALTTIIVNTIFRESGLSVNNGRKKAMLQAEDEFAKN